MFTLEDLRQKARTSRATWLRFSAARVQRPDALHLFVEGYDDQSYYSSIFHRLFPDQELVIYVCFGRSRALDVRRYVSGNAGSYGWILFIVDLDLALFDGSIVDLIGPPASVPTFVTSGYSVENYVAVPQCASRVWVELWRLGSLDERVAVLESMLHDALLSLARASLPMLAWCVVMRRRGQKVNLNAVKAAELFSCDVDLSLGVVRVRRTQRFREHLDRMADQSGADAVEWGDVLETALLMTDVPYPRWLRGKYAAWLVATVLEQTLVLSGSRPTGVGALSASNLIERVGPRMPVPADVERTFRWSRRLWKSRGVAG